MPGVLWVWQRVASKNALNRRLLLQRRIQNLLQQVDSESSSFPNFNFSRLSVFQLSAFQHFPQRTAGSTSGTGRRASGGRTSQPAPRIPAGHPVRHRRMCRQTRRRSQAPCRRRAPQPEPNVHREKSRQAAVQPYNPHRRTRLHPNNRRQHQPPATQSQRASTQPRPAPKPGQPPRQPAQTPPACSTSPESPLAPPPSPASFASPSASHLAH